MKKYDVKCPKCGAMNRGLYLDETKGWMECEKCGETEQVVEYAPQCLIPVCTMEQLPWILGKASCENSRLRKNGL